MRTRLGGSALLGAGIVIAGHLFGPTLMAGKPFRSGPGAVRWTGGHVRIGVSREVHTGGETGVAAEESAAAVHRAVADAVRAWGETGVAAITVEAELSTAKGALAGETLVTFTDTAPFDQGICDGLFIACTILRYDEGTGEILSASVAFNPYKRHSASGIAGTHDIGLVMLHEMGHVLGLDHSAVLDAVMSPEVELDPATGPGAVFPMRRLAFDDRLTLASVYPDGKLARLRGRVSGGGLPIAGAHVIAIDRGGHPVVGGISDAMGNYELFAPAGEYAVVAEPLDGPVMNTHFFTVGEVGPAFPTRYWSGDGAVTEGPEWLAVEEGGGRDGIDFALTAAAVKNVSTIGVIENGQYWGSAKTQVARGGRYTLAVTRGADDGDAAIEPWGDGWMLEGAPNSPASAPHLLRQKLSVNSDPGAYVLAYRHPDGVSLLAGAITVVPSPVVESARVAEGLLTLRGSGLGWGDHSAVPLILDGAEAPNPVQLGGASVRVNGRWIPLRRVSPGEIVAEFGGEIRGPVTVITGTGVSATVELP